jgi:hypothetical protein
MIACARWAAQEMNSESESARLHLRGARGNCYHRPANYLILDILDESGSGAETPMATRGAAGVPGSSSREATDQLTFHASATFIVPAK